MSTSSCIGLLGVSKNTAAVGSDSASRRAPPAGPPRGAAQLRQGVAGGLKDRARGRRGQPPPPLVEVGPVDEDRLDAPPRQDLVQDDEARAEQPPGADDPVALPQQR